MKNTQVEAQTADELLKNAAMSGDNSGVKETKTAGARRKFTEVFKEKIVRQAEAQPKGKVAEFLAKNGLTPSHYYQWKSSIELKNSKKPQKPTPTPGPGPGTPAAPPVETSNTDMTALLEENRRLRLMIMQTEILFEFQGRVQKMLAEEQQQQPLTRTG